MAAKEVSWYRYVSYGARATWVILMNIFLTPSYVAWMLISSPLRLHPVTEELYWKINGFLYRHLLAQIALWCYTGGYTRECYY